MAGNSGGPWGGGGGSGGGNRGNDNDDRGGRRPTQGQQIPEIDEIVRKGQEQLRVLMGGRGGRSGGSGGDGEGPSFGRGSFIVGGIALLALWAYASVYTVAPEERAVELFLGERFAVREPGLNFAPWPIVTAEVVEVTTNRTESIGTARSGSGCRISSLCARRA